MAVNSRQLAHLNEMGITLWQRKAITSQPAKIKQQLPLLITKEALINQRIYVDIIQSLQLSLVDITFEKYHLDLGLFNWKFTDSDQVSFEDSQLITPTLLEISKSVTLKKQLWQLFNKHNLIT
ncbi:DNA polymerase III subunit psi [Colwelliaceae bacterium 6441]